MHYIITTLMLIVLVLVIQIIKLEGSGTEILHNATQTKQIRNTKLPACQACKILIDSFYLELNLQSENLKKYNEEQREIVENNSSVFLQMFSNLCREDKAKDQCLTLADKCKDDLRNWWLSDESKKSDLLNYLCIEKLRYCCPYEHYGPDCKPCLGYPNVCSGNGKCKGNGTRKGNGHCSCDVGYVGSLCDECASSYYVSYRDETKLLCTRCHSSCGDNCSGAGAKGCLSCRNGWRMDKIKGCIDINECFSKRSPCKRNEFCVNNEGSYSCLACDPSCDTCTGDGPDMCERCASGYFLVDNICVNEKSHVTYSDITRYLTYSGLCFATYIIFQNSPWTASLIGLCVAIYVTVSEYMLGTLATINCMSFSKCLEVLENFLKY